MCPNRKAKENFRFIVVETTFQFQVMPVRDHKRSVKVKKYQDNFKDTSLRMELN